MAGIEYKKIYAPKKGEIKVEEFEIGEPAPDEVQVEVEYSVISPGTERAWINAATLTGAVFPLEIGYSSAGEVTRVGENVTGFKEGDIVACECKHQSMANVNERRVYKIPEGVNVRDAAFVEIGIIAMQGIRKANIGLGEPVVVFGQGLIGIMAMMEAKASGAYPVIAVDRDDVRLGLSQKCGADFVIDTRDKEYKEKLQAAAGNRGIPVVIESTGYPEPVKESLDIVSDFGRVILLGSTRQTVPLNLYTYVHRKGVTIVGAHVRTMPEYDSRPGYWTKPENAQAFLNALKYNKINVEDLITQEIEPDGAYEAYREIFDINPEYVATVINWG